MKHAFPRLLLAATALAAVLSACGGSDSAATPPKTPVLDNPNATRTAGLLGFGSRRPQPDDPPSSDLGGSPPPSPPDLSALGLQIGNGQDTGGIPSVDVPGDRGGGDGGGGGDEGGHALSGVAAGRGPARAR